MSGEKPIMDPKKIEEFRSYSDGNDDFIKELFTQYEESTRAILQRLEAAHKNSDTKQVLSEIHAMKGSTRNMGLVDFGDFIVDWEKKVKEQGSADFPKDFAVAQQLFQKVLVYRKEKFPA